MIPLPPYLLQTASIGLKRVQSTDGVLWHKQRPTSSPFKSVVSVLLCSVSQKSILMKSVQVTMAARMMIN